MEDLGEFGHQLSLECVGAIEDISIYSVKTESPLEVCVCVHLSVYPCVRLSAPVYVCACPCVSVCLSSLWHCLTSLFFSVDIPLLVKTGRWRNKARLLEDAAAGMEFFFHQKEPEIHIKTPVICFMNRVFPIKGIYKCIQLTLSSGMPANTGFI